MVLVSTQLLGHVVSNDQGRADRVAADHPLLGARTHLLQQQVDHAGAGPDSVDSVLGELTAH